MNSPGMYGKRMNVLQFTGVCGLQQNPVHLKVPSARSWILCPFFALACTFSASKNARYKQ